MLSVIVAMSENGVIGKDNQLPWHLSADLKRFRRLTTGHHIVMGRKTHESIGRVLPDRTSIVITRDAEYDPGDDRVLVATNLDDAIACAADDDEVFVIGGAQIYAMALPRAERLHLTVVHEEFDGDVSLTAINFDEWQMEEDERHEPDNRNPHAYSFRVYRRLDVDRAQH